MCAMVTREPVLATASLVATCFVTWGCQCAHGVMVVQYLQQGEMVVPAAPVLQVGPLFPTGDAAQPAPRSPEEQ